MSPVTLSIKFVVVHLQYIILSVNTAVSTISHTDEHITKLLPLGFTRKEIRRELFLSNGDLNTAASKLLDRRQKQSEEGSTPFPSGCWEEVDAESGSEVLESQDKDKKFFSVGSIEVCDVY